MVADIAVWFTGGVTALSVPPAWLTWRKGNVNAWMTLLEQSGGVTVAHLEAAFDRHPLAAELFSVGVDAAAKTHQATRHKLIAALVAAGLTDPEGADIDVLLLLERTAVRLDDPHIHLLLLIDDHPPQPLTDSPNVAVVDLTDDVLATLWPEAANADAIMPLRQALEREGLIVNSNPVVRRTAQGIVSLSTTESWQISPFGQRMVDYYRALGGGSRVRPG